MCTVGTIFRKFCENVQYRWCERENSRIKRAGGSFGDTFLRGTGLTLFHKIHLEVLGREQCVGERSSLKPLHLNMLKDDVDNKAVQLVCKLALCSLCPHVDDTD